MDDLNVTTRRALLKGIPAAAAAVALPAPAESAEADELPVEKLHRLGGEIAKLLADDPDRPFDQVTITADWIMQSKKPDHAAAVDRIRKLCMAHQRALERFEASCPASDPVDPQYEGKSGERRNARLDRAEARAFNALLAEPTPDVYAAHNKASYLLGMLQRSLGLGDEDVAALLSSMLHG